MAEFFVSAQAPIAFIVLGSLILSLVFYIFNTLDYFLYIVAAFTLMMAAVFLLLGNFVGFFIDFFVSSILWALILYYRFIKDH
ncbi:MAG: hypothetical protein ACLFRI_05875 [Candidatus Izemoplasmataceae bacterium]